jgi:hypothetical protein
MHTYDGMNKKGLLNFDGKIGRPPLTIIMPESATKERSLFDPV